MIFSVDNLNKILSKFQIINGLLFLDIHFDYPSEINYAIVFQTHLRLFVCLPQPNVKQIKPIKLRGVELLRRRNRSLRSETTNLKLYVLIRLSDGS
jgi:hypothetical protein